MANNRLVLICKICNPNKEMFNDNCFVLAKWYPFGPYYTHKETTFDFNNWLYKHDHGEYPFIMEYEIEE